MAVVAEGSRDAPAPPPGERAPSRRVLVMGGDIPVPVLAGRDRPGPDVEPWAAGVPPVRTAPPIQPESRWDLVGEGVES